MSGITTICMITSEFEEACGFDSYKHIPFGGSFGFWLRCGFTIMDYFPLIITIGKMVIGAIIGSVALYVSGVALFLDLMVNHILQSIIQQDGPKPCLVADSYQMPALASQTVSFFVTGFLLFCIIYRRVVGTYLLWLIYILGCLALYKRAFDQINTVEQLVVGACVGFLDAIIMHGILYWKIQYYIPMFCDTALAKVLHANNYCFRRDRLLDKEEQQWFNTYQNEGMLLRKKEQQKNNLIIGVGKRTRQRILDKHYRKTKRRHV